MRKGAEKSIGSRKQALIPASEIAAASAAYLPAECWTWLELKHKVLARATGAPPGSCR
jgi:hypothetical protein